MVDLLGVMSAFFQNREPSAMQMIYHVRCFLKWFLKRYMFHHAPP